MNVPLLELRTIMSQYIHEELERFTDEGLTGAVKAFAVEALGRRF